MNEDKYLRSICHAYLEFPLFIFNSCMVFCGKDGQGVLTNQNGHSHSGKTWPGSLLLCKC